MNSEEQQQGEVGRRKFDDVTSLFGRIVPPPGTPVRPAATPEVKPISTTPLDPAAAPRPVNDQPAARAVTLPSPDPLPDPAPPATIPAPNATTPAAAPAEPRPARPRSPPLPVAPEREKPRRDARGRTEKTRKPASSELPWPDAFAPRPNFERKRTARSFTWILLIPLGAVVATGIVMLDPRAIRDFIDRTMLQIQPRPATDAPSLLPAPFRPGATVSPSSPPASAVSAPVDPTPIAPAPAVPAPIVTAPASGQTDLPPPPPPPSNPPATEGGTKPSTSPAPAASIEPPAIPVPPPEPPAPAAASPAPAVAEPSFARVTIIYRRGSTASEAEARRIAARVERAAVAVDIRPSGTILRAPVITYYNLADKDAAAALARSLAGEGGSWIVRPGPTRSAAGSLDISLP